MTAVLPLRVHLSQGGLPQLPYYLYDQLANLRRGRLVGLDLRRQEVENAVGKLACQKSVRLPQLFRGGVQRLANLVGLEWNETAIALIDQGGQFAGGHVRHDEFIPLQFQADIRYDRIL